MRAVILAGGKATRLYPITLYMPKQLIMINGHPAIHYIFNHCVKAGIKDFVLCISDNTLKDHFINALGDGSSLGINITYSINSEEMGTAGRVLSAGKFLNNDKQFIVYYGDIITNFDLAEMIANHRKKHGVCTLATSSSKVLEFGICRMDGSTDVKNFVERPAISELSDAVVNCGIAVCDRQVLKYCKKNGDFFGDTIPGILHDGLPVNSFDIETEFYDIGSYSIIERVLKYLKKHPRLLKLEGIKGSSHIGLVKKKRRS